MYATYRVKNKQQNASVSYLKQDIHTFIYLFTLSITNIHIVFLRLSNKQYETCVQAKFS